jgi:eukaryotic-like serine/threonine-protein kinase
MAAAGGALTYIGSTIGNIRIEAQLGTGGMGEVYRGFDPRLERRVAVKTIRPEQRLSPQVKARFLREARLLSKLGHPSICQVYDLIETPEADFLILEYVEGQTLRQLAAGGRLTLEEKLRLAEKIAAALAVAHREKIVHRDLKADNVMVTPAGEVKVLDFGIARSLAEPDAPPPIRLPPPLPEPGGTAPLWTIGDDTAIAGDGDGLTRQGMVVGTIHAMSPEQAMGGEVTEASDLYSFGILLQELFTGEPAYEGEEEAALFWQVLRAETRPITGLDPDLTRLIQDLESLDPRRRPTTAEAAERLRFIRDRPQRLRRRRLRLAATVGAFVILLVVLAAVSWLAVEAERARREAERRRQQAEDLIGFMLGDLRKRLEAVNRLDVLDAAGNRALAYFDQVPESQLTGDELALRVQAIGQIGLVRRAQGDLPAALDAFRRAETLAGRLAVRDPGRADWQLVRAQTADLLGQVLLEQGDVEGALREWQGALGLARNHVERFPGEPVWINNLALANHNVGTLLEFKGDLDGALRHYRRSLDLQRQLEAKGPEDPERLAQIAATLAFVSNTLERQGDLAGSLAERRSYLATQERALALAPGNPVRRHDVAIARGFVAGLLAARGDTAAGRDLYQSGLGMMSELAAQDPENTELQRWLGAFHGALGALETTEGRPGRALPALKKACDISSRLAARDATNSDWRLQLGVCHIRMAQALESLDPARARGEARAAEQTLSPLLTRDVDEPTRGYIATASVVRGRIESARGDQKEARAAWNQALEVLAPCRRPITHWKVLAPWAQALLELDRLDEARPAVERLERMGYRAPDFAEVVGRKGVRRAADVSAPSPTHSSAAIPPPGTSAAP